MTAVVSTGVEAEVGVEDRRGLETVRVRVGGDELGAAPVVDLEAERVAAGVWGARIRVL
ncbi:MAG: hypothetical protein ACYSWU_08270 [Planctomycetota bacterium]